MIYTVYIAGGMQNVSFFKKQELFLETLSFRQLSLSGRILIIKEKTQLYFYKQQYRENYQYPENYQIICYLTVLLTVIILKELDSL